MGRFPEQETCLFLALGASPSGTVRGAFLQVSGPFSFQSYSFSFFHHVLGLTLKAMKRIGMRKKSSMHFIVLKVCKSQNKKEK